MIGHRVTILVDILLIIYWTSITVGYIVFHYRPSGFQIAFALISAVLISIQNLITDIRED